MNWANETLHEDAIQHTVLSQIRALRMFKKYYRLRGRFGHQSVLQAVFINSDCFVVSIEIPSIDFRLQVLLALL